MDRNEVRQRTLKARMALLPESVKERSDIIVSRIISLEEYRKAQSVMVYVDFRNEVLTGRLINQALQSGKQVSVPITDVKGKRLTPSRILDYPGDLEPGAWGILEPREGCVRPLDPLGIDFIIVPGVAYDEGGNRLGYGGGFYDRFLPRTGQGAVYLAPAFEVQLVEDVFPGPLDVPVHIIVTEERVINAARVG
ncbi:MAG: 5-formyltetrahydrofolate cyclo-ligase [Bacillota bacterium]